MSDGSSSLSPSEIGVVDHPPCRPPLEIIQDSEVWLVREYQLQHKDATVFDTYHDRIDAMRAAQDRMEDDRHPCLLRWDDHDIVGDLYWNKLFKELHLTYSDLLDAWVLVPGTDHYVFQSGESLDAIRTAARAVQRQYDFKHLIVYDQAGTKRVTVDHRFLRYDIAASGVRFDRGQPFGSSLSPSSASDTDDAEKAAENRRVATPASTLMAAIPDLSDLEELDVSGPVLQYRATWETGELTRIALLDPDLTAERDIVQQFTKIIDDWERLSDAATVTTVFEVGPSPAAWIAYRAGEGTLADCIGELSRHDRLRLLNDVATAVETAHTHGIHRTEIAPSTVRVRSQGGQVRASLADWGLERAVESARGETIATPYTAPEQLAGRVTPTTAIYQLGALAYRLICDHTPFSDASDSASAIRAGKVTPPTSIMDVPASVDTVVRRAMATIPDQRYSAPSQFIDRLTTALKHT